MGVGVEGCRGTGLHTVREALALDPAAGPPPGGVACRGGALAPTTRSGAGHGKERLKPRSCPCTLLRMPRVGSVPDHTV